MEASVRDDKPRRWLLFRNLSPYYGRLVSAEFLRNPRVLPGVDRVHPLIEGIYKPAWTDFATCIVSMLHSPYADQLRCDETGDWWLKYSPKSGGMGRAQNMALLNCMRLHEPIVVLRQVLGNTKQGSQYRIVGLGLIEHYDAGQSVFTVHRVDLATLEAVCAGISEDETLASALRSEILLPFTLFEQPKRAIYQVSKDRRDAAFNKVVLDQYGYACAVTGQRYRSQHHVEAQAAHIVPKKEHGSDDPRNGFALSHTLHWAFDVGLFTVSDQYEVIVHPKASLANGKAFPLLRMGRCRITLPEDEEFWPHPDALNWHRKEIFDKFHL